MANWICRARRESEGRLRAGRRLSCAGVIAGAMLIAPSAAGAAARPAAAPSAKAPTDVTVLFGQAVKKVRAARNRSFPHATVLEADGNAPGGRCTPLGCTSGRPVRTAAGIVSWRFVFALRSPQSSFYSATLFYGPAPQRFGKLTLFASPFLGDIPIVKAPKLTLAGAIKLLRAAGHRQPFVDLTLRNPLGPQVSNPQYIFGFASGSFISVDTVTKQVRRVS